MSHPLTPDAALHGQLRKRGASSALALLVGAYILSPLYPPVRAILGVSPWITGVGGGVALALMGWANVAYHRWGLRSRHYDRANALETTAFTAASAIVVCASGRADNVAWLFYAGHLVHCGVAGYQRRYNSVLFSVVPALMVLWFAVFTELGATLLVCVFGLFSLFIYRMLSHTAVQLRETTLQRNALASELTALRLEEERQRIARDLHDGIGSDLAALHWQIEGLRACLPQDEERDRFFETLRQRLTQGSGELRNIVWELRAGELLWQELGAYLSSRCQELCGESMACEFSLEGDPSSLLPSELHVQVARFVQEGVRNAVRHSGARRVRVRLSLREALHLTVEDDGQGVRQEALHKAHGGLRNMRRRVESLGGEFRVNPASPGTCLSARIPLMTR